jgi:shikimate dehydrogenase
MQRYAIIGSPVNHSLSPAMQQAAFDALGIEATYEPIEASIAQPIMARLSKQGFCGWNVTTPLKEQAVASVDSLSDAARRARAVNVVRKDGDRLVGHNTDGEGFVRAVSELWTERALSGSVLVLGAGPAARAIACALADAGVEELSCWSRDEGRARLVAPEPRGQPHLVVWALPPEARLPDAIAALADRAALFFDCNYGEGRSARGRGAGAYSDGLSMLLHQGVLSFTWWTGREAPEEQMRAALARSAPSIR